MGCASSQQGPGRGAPSNVDTEKWDDFFPPMTLQELEDKRIIFWETRVEGRTEIWQALNMSIDVERNGDSETAETILTSIGCNKFKISKNNKETKFCYDSYGVRYDVPMYIFEEPKNLISLPPSAPNANEYEQKQDNILSRGEGELINSINNSKKIETISFIVRLCIGKDLKMIESSTISILELKHSISKKINNLDPTRIRILFKGKLMKDHYRLNAPFIVTNNDIVQAAFPSSLYKPDNNINPQNIDMKN